MSARRRRAEFERLFLPQLSSAYNFARWLTRDSQDAEDLVQEAFLKAFRAFDSYAGGDSNAWLLRTLRNTYLTWLKQRQKQNVIMLKDAYRNSEVPDLSEAAILPQRPDDVLAQKTDRDRIHAAIAELPQQFREVIVLRELEGLSYRQIGGIVGVPVGTVMSRLSRGRRKLHDLLVDDHEGRTNEL